MARQVRWCSPLVKMCLIFGISTMSWIGIAAADCFYDDQRYEEGVEVETLEHCLNCTCTRGVLLCYLRVCPNLPNPPPVGCILLHRYRTCCPELICSEFTGDGNALEARSEPEGFDLLPFEGEEESDACISNGSIYAPGSAMDSSSHCEYCYCLRGKQTCVQPKCLLPIDGCTPTYDTNQCCPVQYNCSSPDTVTSTTTTMLPKINFNLGGCIVDNEFYNEGDKVLGIGHSVCDNCYCLRGMLRCEPLSCAPPLLGCTPIVKPGECCAASYNCTGSIEIDPEPNYGQYPIVSAEYSKLRKEQPKKPYTSHSNRRNKPEKKNTNDPFYVIAESAKSITKPQRTQATSGTTRQFTGFYFNPSTTTPFYYKSMIKEGAATNGFKHVTRSYPESKFRSSTLNDDDGNLRKMEHRPEVTIDSKGISTTLNLIDATLTEDFDEVTETTTKVFTTEETTAAVELTSTLDSDLMSTTTIEGEELRTTNDEVSTTEENSSLLPGTEYPETITIKSVLNSTDCINGPDLSPAEAENINNLEETNQYTPSFEASSTESTDITEIDLQSSFALTDNVSAKTKNGSKIPSLLNSSKTKENDYDMDYNEPSLPPSLPNLHIIPFLAADALDTQKENDNALYAQDKSSNDSFEFPNLFSPPVETEGGFVPNSNPVILETLYDNAMTTPSLSGSTGNKPASCSSRGENIQHGQSVASDSPCTTCTCFYGNIVCQKVPCPAPRPNCRKSIEDLTLCCPIYLCDSDDDLSSPNPKQSEASILNKPPPQDPFRDVIKTEPAPDLQSLIGDMLPHLTKKPVKKTTIYITTLQPVTTYQELEHTTKKTDESLGIDSVLELLLRGLDSSGSNTTTQENLPSSNSQKVDVTNLSNNLVTEDRNTSAAILKLAGCNIYGRMYRVGRIISELSGPCLECKCTEVGVQCKHLKC